MYKRCIYCGGVGNHKHHVVKRSQSGTNNPENLVNLCYECHIIKLHGKRDKDIIKRCYDYIKPNFAKCYKSESVQVSKIKLYYQTGEV